MKEHPLTPFVWKKLLWALLPLAVFVFACAAGRERDYNTAPNFPRADAASPTPPAAKATLYVYSSQDQAVLLRATFRVAAPRAQPPLRITIEHDGVATAAATAVTYPAEETNSISAAASLRLVSGTNAVRLTLGAAETNPTPFLVKSVHITGSIFNAGNILFCLTLSTLVAASILGARALGAVGLHTFCAAALIGFLLLTATATILSPLHLLDGPAWAAAMIATSLAVGAAARWRLKNHPPLAPAPENTLRPLGHV